MAAELGVGRVFVKDESSRLGLPAFKALGATWAVHRALADHAEPVTLVTATDGNHGRAVARTARLLGQRALVFVPEGVHPAAVAAIVAEGAEVTEVAGSYDDAVRAAATAASGAVLIQDMAWPGYEQIPRWIVEGYSTLCWEIDEQLGEVGPDLVAIPVGVGSLAQAVVTHYRSQPGRPPVLLSVEPLTAACVLESLTADKLLSITTGQTVMAGLNCGTPSSLAWPVLRNGLDASVAIPDAASTQAAADLAALGVSSGPCGAASLAGVRAVLTDRGALGLDANSTVVLLNTEGAAANPA